MPRSGKEKARAQTCPRRRKPIAEASSDLPLSKFTMRETARHTEGRKSRPSRSCLRHQTVPFVSASDMQPGERVDPEPAETDTETQDAEISPIIDTTKAEENAIDIGQHTDTTEIFMAMPSRSVPSPRSPIQICPEPLCSPGDSSEDEIVFYGRNRHGRPAQQAQDPLSQKGSRFRPISRASRDLGYREEIGSEEPQGCPTTTTSTDILPMSGSDAVSHHLSYGHTPGTGLGEEVDYMEIDVSSAKRECRWTRADDENAVMDDYIANMDNDYDDLLNICNLQRGIDNTDLETRSASPTSTGSIATHALEILFGPEVSPPRKGSAISDWGIENHNQVSDASIKVQRRKAKHKNLLAKPRIESSEDSSNVASNYDVQQSLDSNRFWNQELNEDACLESEADQHRANGLEYEPREQSSTSARALELDLLYNLDMLGLNMKAGQKKKKAKKHKPTDLILSDSELELGLEKAWQNDREKKKVRKQKREELRSQGLLGRGSKKPDLRTKYSDGMDLHDFKLETKRFLLSSKNSLSLPPMNKQQRKLVHDVAGALSLKSKSRGHGSSRFPVLHKTGRTPPYTPRVISRVDKIFSGANSNCRLARSWHQNTGSGSGKGRTGRADRSVSYMDGDVVGASAPEIGVENKGRAMLEKMGWSTGTALGATNNKGILLPVPHIVKNTRAGLG